MTQQWRTRVTAATVVAGLTAGLAALSGDGLDYVAFVVVVFCVASLGWLGVDLLGATDTNGPGLLQSAPAAGARRGGDMRTTRLSRRLAEIGRPGYNEEVLWEEIVDLIDGRLVRLHDIDRRSDPSSAALVLGPRLTAFVTACPPSRQFARRSYLDAIITDIEEL